MVLYCTPTKRKKKKEKTYSVPSTIKRCTSPLRLKTVCKFVRLREYPLATNEILTYDGILEVPAFDAKLCASSNLPFIFKKVFVIFFVKNFEKKRVTKKAQSPQTKKFLETDKRIEKKTNTIN